MQGSSVAGFDDARVLEPPQFEIRALRRLADSAATILKPL